MAEFSLTNLRTGTNGIRESFEEFCCQLFRRAEEAPADARYRRIRGAGGDGGVEATWEATDGPFWGLQSKWFDTLGSSQKSQMRDSLRQARANYPQLSRYTFCLPMTLTGKKGALGTRATEGQHGRIDEWIAEWEAEYSEAPVPLTIDFWDETELLDRLTRCDPDGGKAQYWFDATSLSTVWFRQRLDDAAAQAGPRYSPKLSVDTGLPRRMAAFGREESWVEEIDSLLASLDERIGRWRRTAPKAGGDAPADLVEDVQRVLDRSEAIATSAARIIDDPRILCDSEFAGTVHDARELAAELEPKLKQQLEETHGAHADTPGFRQYQAEYNATFPMASLDGLRELLRILERFADTLTSDEPLLPSSKRVLVHGPAGIGKTHGILDVAYSRHIHDLFTIVLFGEDLNDSDPWSRIPAKLSLGQLGWNTLLDALDAAGEVSGYPLLICIDAINETSPDRKRWNAWLGPLSEQIGRRDNLKLCVTCRDAYLRESVPEAYLSPAVEHNGFAGQEQEAAFQFFRHYGLGVPTEPLLQDEFGNPLFLHLVCRALQASGESAIPLGRQGMRSVLSLLIQEINQKAAEDCGYDARTTNRVEEAVGALAGRMAAASGREIPLPDAQAAVAAVDSGSGLRSLFDFMERESLLAVTKHAPDGFGAEPTYTVRFTFERVADHFIAEQLLAGLDDAESVKAEFAAGGSLNFLVASGEALREHAGLAEAVAVHVAEVHSLELVDVVELDATSVARPVLAGLQWRDPGSITRRTVEIAEQATRTQELAEKAWEALYRIATRREHPLNADTIDAWLGTETVLERDPYWSYIVGRSFERPTGGVPRLIDWAVRGHLHAIDDTVALLWARVLAWFCAVPDRRIRDRSTKGLVRVFRARPEIIPALIDAFARIDDEYVSERVLVASYGALLLSRDAGHIHAAASAVHRAYFSNPMDTPLNASLRDHARLIVELAVDEGVKDPDICEANCRPPYQSSWPIELPSESEVASYGVDHERFPRMELVEKVGFAVGTDFARYVVSPRITSEFDIESEGLEEIGIFRWFLKRAIDFGYPGPGDRCATYDRMVLAHHGGGRGRPGWAERLGKKYYWIFLRQLVGQIADHVARKSWTGPSSPPSDNLQGLDLRDIDPTDVRGLGGHDRVFFEWYSPPAYPFPAGEDPARDREWVAEDDLVDLAEVLVGRDPEDSGWHVLALSTSWQGQRRRGLRTRREVRVRVQGITCDLDDLPELERLFSANNWPTDLFSLDPQDYRGYLGEYPSGWAYSLRIGSDIRFEGEYAGLTCQAVALTQLRGGEWEYDYSVDGGAPALLVPSPALVEFGDLAWDGTGAWTGPDGIVRIGDPYWNAGERQGLIGRTAWVDEYLLASRKALLLFGFQQKTVLGGLGDQGPGMLLERTVFVRVGGKTRRLGGAVETIGNG